MDDLSLMRLLAQVMEWGEYKEGAPSSDTYLVRSAVIHRFTPTYGWLPWRPLESMDDAKQIIGCLVSQGWEYFLGSCTDGHYALFSRYDRRPGRPWPEWYSEVASSLERAIVLAALRTMEGVADA